MDLAPQSPRLQRGLRPSPSSQKAVLADSDDLLVKPWVPARYLLLYLALCTLSLLVGTASAGEVSLHLEEQEEAPELSSILVEGLEAPLLDALRAAPPTRDDWQAIFPFYTGNFPTKPGGKPPVAGSWTIEANQLRFRPRYPLVPGLEYSARLDIARLRELAGTATVPAAPLEATFSLPKEHVEPSTVVSTVYPTASVLPENLLKLYLHFSAPMARGDAYRHIRLLDEEGNDLKGSFLEVGEELWDATQQRLTIFFDPGRIKRGLRPHEEAGPPLNEGGSYRLVIDDKWHDAAGLPLAREFEKVFTATAADRRSPDPNDWRIEPPRAETRQPLRLSFPESLDHALLERVVRILDAEGTDLPGRVEITDEERVLHFVPERPWIPGDYRVATESILEDLAGNNLNQVFDLDIRAPQPAKPPADRILLPFSVDAPEISAVGAAHPRQKPYDVPSTDLDVEIDGRLDEMAWAHAVSIPLAYETRPGENIPALVQTDLLITHDRDRLYIAFRAFDPDPSEIRARLADRDSAFSDDWVGVSLDTFNDGLRAFEFFVNPLGVQMDLTMDDVNDNEDSSWDAIWDSAGRVTETGYVVEVAVPFSSIRFPRTSGPQTWGIDALRMYPRNTRHRLGLHPQDRNIDCYVCQFSKLRGFAGITPGRNLEINPTFTAGYQEERDNVLSGPTSDFASSDDNDLGLTVGWGITPNLRLSGTLNPDFSQVEADVAQLDVNTQFALFFPERRPFFLEDADFFNTQLNAVFTRNVADPTWGVRVTGKTGKHAFGAFVAEDELTNLLFPGNQESDSDSFDFSTSDAVLRYRRDLPRNSTIGALYTSREGSGYSNQVAGVDGRLRLSKSDRFTFQYLRSETEYPNAIVQDFEQPSGSFDDDAWRVSFVHADRDWRTWMVYEDIGDGFRADMGFIPRVGFKHSRGGVMRTWWGEEKAWYDQLVVGVNYDRVEDQQGLRLEASSEVWFEIEGPKQSEVEVEYWRRDRHFDGLEFDENLISGSFEVQPTSKVWLSFRAEAGDRVDFANSRLGESFVIEPTLRLDFGKHLRTRFSHRIFRLDVPGGQSPRRGASGTLFEAGLTQARFLYQLNLRTFVRAVFQYTDIDRDLSLYNEPEDFEAREEELFTQLLFSYKLNPRTVLFLGYSDNYLGDQDIELTQENRALFLKIGYAWVL